MASDRPKNVINVSDLDMEENQDPVKVPIGGSKFVTFPDVFDMPIEEAEAFFADLNRGQAIGAVTPALKRWLPEKDYAALVKAFPTMRKLQPVIERVMAKYESSWGSTGEGTASES